MDLGSTPVKDFTTQTYLEKTNSQHDPSLQSIDPTQEGLQDDKTHIINPTIIPTNILPNHKRPTHHKPDIIRVVGYKLNSQGMLIEDTTYKGRRYIQIIEGKYSTDSNILETITNIYTIYEPLKQAILQHNRGRLEVEIIPIVISRTGNFHTRTLAELAQLITFKENPPNALTYKTLPPQAKRIVMALHIHAQEWLTLMSKVSRSILTLRHQHKNKQHHNTDR
jgi:hypothetical protein